MIEACIIVEPILAGAGCILPDHDYLLGLQEFAKKNDIIFILDEIVTGFEYQSMEPIRCLIWNRICLH